MKTNTIFQGLVPLFAVVHGVSSARLESAPVAAALCGEEGVKQLSGYYKIQDEGATDKEYFFWMAESQDRPSEDPLILWLTGGPGCSSTLALLAENGPCTVNEDGETTMPNPSSWNSRANVVWVDQPAGVGFSYGKAPGDFDHGEDAVGEDMFWFLQEFFATHPEYASNPFYVFGESYGGHYAPSVAHRVWQGIKNGEGSAINLQGMGIGNGLTSPAIQYPFYTQMAVDNPYGVKAVSEKDAAMMRAYTPACVALIDGCQDVPEMCDDAQSFCDEHMMAPYMLSGLNPYDVRKQCGDQGLCYDFSAIEKFLRLDSTREALNVRDDSAPWESCNMKVNSDFSGDWMREFDGLIGPMLEDGVSVLIYAGDCDWICNYMGNEAWTLSLDWTGGDGFRAAPQIEWSTDAAAAAAGLSRSYGGLTFLQVYEAGHMVPMDQPEVALAMLNAFVHEDARPFEQPQHAGGESATVS
ncbi:unnamed protein product [Ectocarpus sp. 6 AP-2014]